MPAIDAQKIKSSTRSILSFGDIEAREEAKGRPGQASVRKWASTPSTHVTAHTVVEVVKRGLLSLPPADDAPRLGSANRTFWVTLLSSTGISPGGSSLLGSGWKLIVTCRWHTATRESPEQTIPKRTLEGKKRQINSLV